ncbi:hypothetical protein HYFRA_00000908 [Hymenoscyphus fraxineus]|uniref:Uncharacterized protein n=1 Tax=Hymenoscyphus fraxineus TaxID=746836 RepID=A0A9N9KQQ3_9HELO|nr:hypothetical protein HYFRA_00000908 [Hymenoscyphus fraxineus]
MVMCPPSSVNVWRDEAERFYLNELVFKQWYGRPEDLPKHREGSLIEGGVTGVAEFLAGIDKEDPAVPKSTIAFIWCQVQISIRAIGIARSNGIEISRVNINESAVVRSFDFVFVLSGKRQRSSEALDRD